MENGAGAEGRDPSGFLSEIIGAAVTVKLNSGVVYKGELLQRLQKSDLCPGTDVAFQESSNLLMAI
jgi:hypothetical protein